MMMACGENVILFLSQHVNMNKQWDSSVISKCSVRQLSALCCSLINEEQYSTVQQSMAGMLSDYVLYVLLCGRDTMYGLSLSDSRKARAT